MIGEFEYDPFEGDNPHDKAGTMHCRLCGDYLITDPCPAHVGMFVSDSGVGWTVVLGFAGLRILKTTPISTRPRLTFYDRTADGHPYFGRYVADYYAETLLTEPRGLRLWSDVPQWVIDDESMHALADWAFCVVPDLTREMISND